MSTDNKKLTDDSKGSLAGNSVGESGVLVITKGVKFLKDGSVMYKTNYANGERDGAYEAYDSLGKLVDKKQYKNGEIVEDLVPIL